MELERTPWPHDTKMISTRPTILVFSLGIVAACTKEPPPRTVSDFMENKILLEAAMVRCGQDRSKLKYDAECVAAREAANRLEVVAEQARREELEAQSEAKRRALRRTQEAAAAARRRAAEEQRLREEAAYLSQFDAAPDGAGDSGQSVETSLPGTAPDQQPVVIEPAQSDSAPQQTSGDLDAIRDELKRRQEKPR